VKSTQLVASMLFLEAASDAVILTAVLSGCATYEKCGLEGCAGDAKVTANVHAVLDQHPELPGAARVVNSIAVTR
jgi:hypothetical protein